VKPPRPEGRGFCPTGSTSCAGSKPVIRNLQKEGVVTGYDAVIRLSFGATSRRSILIVCAFIHGQARGLLRRRIKPLKEEDMKTSQPEVELGEKLVRQLWADIKDRNTEGAGKMIAQGFQSVHQDGARNREQTSLLLRMVPSLLQLTPFLQRRQSTASDSRPKRRPGLMSS